MQGIIRKGIGSFYTIRCAGQDYTCRPRGRFREEKLSPQVGDWVEFHGGETEDGYIDAILPRTNLLPRPPLANVTRLIFVISAQRPMADLLLVDKMLVYAAQLQLQAALVINKCDLADPARVEALRAQYAQARVQVVCTSAATGAGVEELRTLLQVGISCFAGQSGAGKSSLLRALFPTLTLDTGDLSRKTGRGRHTTRHVELIPVGEAGYAADTPGFSMLDLAMTDPAFLALHYPEFEPFAGECRFHGCRHDKEPDCAVKAALQAGQIHPLRYERYQILLHEMQQQWRNRYDSNRT